MRKRSTVLGTKQESLISSKHKALGIALVATVATAAIVLTVQMVQANEASQKKLKHDIEMQQILQERKTQEQIKSQKDELQQQIKTLEQRVEAKKANALASAAKAAESVATRVIPHAQASGGCVEWMLAAGVTDIGNATWLINKESGCNPNAVNRSSGACGIPQALPCSKLGTKDPVAQIRWMQDYVNRRYGGWAGAVAFHRSHNWY